MKVYWQSDTDQMTGNWNMKIVEAWLISLHELWTFMALNFPGFPRYLLRQPAGFWRVKFKTRSVLVCLRLLVFLEVAQKSKWPCLNLCAIWGCPLRPPPTFPPTMASLWAPTTTTTPSTRPGTNCIKIGLPGKSIIGDYFQENRGVILKRGSPGEPRWGS